MAEKNSFDDMPQEHADAKQQSQQGTQQGTQQQSEQGTVQGTVQSAADDTADAHHEATDSETGAEHNSSLYQRLAHTPLQLFAMVMGTSGLALAWQTAVEQFDFPEVFGLIFYFTALVVFVGLVFAYLVRVIDSPRHFLEDIRNPQQLPYLATTTVALLLLVAASDGILSDSVTKGFWWLATIGHFLVLLVTLRMWMRPRFTINDVSPAWFMPSVGALLIPVEGLSMGLIENRISVLALAIGLTFWIGLLPVVFYRMFAAEESIPSKYVPTLFIMVSPPSIAANVFYNGTPSVVPTILYHVAIAMLLVALLRLPELFTARFGMPHWGLTYPLTALTAVSLKMDYPTIGQTALFVVTAVILLIWALTIVNLLQGRVFHIAGSEEVAQQAEAEDGESAPREEENTNPVADSDQDR